MARYYDSILGSDNNSGADWDHPKKTFGAVGGMAPLIGTEPVVLARGCTFTMPGPVAIDDPGGVPGDRANPGTGGKIRIISDNNPNADERHGAEGSPILKSARPSTSTDWTRGSLLGVPTAPTWSRTSYAQGAIIKYSFADRWTEKQVSYGLRPSTVTVTVNYKCNVAHTPAVGDTFADWIDARDGNGNPYWLILFTPGSSATDTMYYTPYLMTGYMGGEPRRRCWPNGPLSSKTSSLFDNFQWCTARLSTNNASGSVVWSTDASGNAIRPDLNPYYREPAQGSGNPHDLLLVPWQTDDIFGTYSGHCIKVGRPWGGFVLEDVDFERVSGSVLLTPVTPSTMRQRLTHGAQISRIQIREAYSGLIFNGNTTAIDPKKNVEWQSVQVQTVAGRNVGAAVVYPGTHRYNTGALGASWIKDVVGWRCAGSEGLGVVYGTVRCDDGGEFLIENISGYDVRHGAYWTADGAIVYMDHESYGVRFSRTVGLECDTYAQQNYADGTVIYEKFYFKARSNGSTGNHAMRADYGYGTGAGNPKAHNVIFRHGILDGFRDPIAIRDINSGKNIDTDRYYTVQNVMMFRDGTASRAAIQKANVSYVTTDPNTGATIRKYSPTLIKDCKYYGYSTLAARVTGDWEDVWYTDTGANAYVAGNAYNVTLSSPSTPTDMRALRASMPVYSAAKGWAYNYALKELPETGWETMSFPGTPPNPTEDRPTLTSIDTTSVAMGSAGFTQYLRGKFKTGDAVLLNGVERAATLDASATVFSVGMGRGDIDEVKTITYTVLRGTLSSDPKSLTVYLTTAPPPVLSSLSFQAVDEGTSGPLSLTVYGSGMVTGDAVYVNGVAVATTLNLTAPQSATINLQSGDMATAGTLMITMRNTEGDESNGLQLAIRAATDGPTLTRLSSSGVLQGSTGLRLRVEALNAAFGVGDVILVGNVDRTTTRISATKLETTDFTASDFDLAGTLTVQVRLANNALSTTLSLPVLANVGADPRSGYTRRFRRSKRGA